MKNTIRVLMAVTLVLMWHFFLNPGGIPAKELQPTVDAVAPVKMSKKAKVTINGKGFNPGQEVTLLFATQDGVETDIGYALKPAPKADRSGSWSTSWDCVRFIRKKLIQVGRPYKITATNREYIPITHTFVSFTR